MGPADQRMPLCCFVKCSAATMFAATQVGRGMVLTLSPERLMPGWTCRTPGRSLLTIHGATLGSTLNRAAENRRGFVLLRGCLDGSTATQFPQWTTTFRVFVL